VPAAVNATVQRALPLVTATALHAAIAEPLSWKEALPPSPGMVAVKVTLSPALLV
jgi:hypothetical protein